MKGLGFGAQGCNAIVLGGWGMDDLAATALAVGRALNDPRQVQQLDLSAVVVDDAKT